MIIAYPAVERPKVGIPTAMALVRFGAGTVG